MANSYSGSDVTKMDRIAKISIKPKKKFGIATNFGDAHVVEIFTDERGEKTYVCDFWVSEGVPYMVKHSQVDTVIYYI